MKHSASVVTYSQVQNVFNSAANGAYTIAMANATQMCIAGSILGGISGIILTRAGVLAHRKSIKDSAYYES